MKRIIFLFATLLIWATAVADRTEDTIYLRIIEDADKAITAGNFVEAEKLLMEAIDSQPGNPSNVLLMSNLGMVRFYMGNDSLALKTLDDAHRMAPASVTVLLNRARVKSSTGMIREAIDDYNIVSSLDSTVIDPYFYRGIINLSQRNIAAAEKDFNRLKSLAPDDNRTALALGSFFLEIAHHAEAIQWFTKLLATEKAPEYYSARALCYIMTDMLGEAAEDIAEGLKLNPNDGELFFCRALLNKKRYRDNDAKADARKAVELGVNKERVKGLL